jgi:hypothetical protein
MTHEGPLDLVREHPEIAVELIRGTAGIKLPGQLAVSLAPTDMSAVVPVQYLADMIVLVTDTATGDPALAVIIEPQLRDSETKRYSWPVYMATEPGARTVLDAIASPAITDADRLRMTAIILSIAPEAARQLLEAMMTTSEYEKTFIERIHDQGIAEGKAEAVLRLLSARGLAPSPEQRQLVTSSTDPAQLDLWFDRAITADTAEDVFTIPR